MSRELSLHLDPHSRNCKAPYTYTNQQIIKPSTHAQACEHVRTDALFVDMNMMPAVWFAKMQGAYLPNVSFPSLVYHAYDFPHAQNQVRGG